MTPVLRQLVLGALEDGADALRLTPGERPVVVTGGAEAPTGEPLAADAVDDAVESLLTPAARMDLALGRARFTTVAADVGRVTVEAVLRNGETHLTVSFDLVGPRPERAAPLQLELDDRAPPSSAAPLDSGELMELEPELHPMELADSSTPGSMPAVLSLSPAPPSLPPALGGGAPRAPGPPSAGLQAPAGLSLPPALGGGAPRAPAQVTAARVAGEGVSLPPALGGLLRAAVPPPRVTSVSSAALPAVGASGQAPASRGAAPAAPEPRPSPPDSPAAVLPIPPAAPVFGAGVLSAELRDLLVATLRARGSDLHLSSRVLPMVRIDGDLRPMTVRGPFTPDALEGLLLPLLPERLRAGFAERRDADFGFEVEGVARFRANVFVDRQGIGAVFRVVPSQIVPAERLGFPQEVLRLCQQPKGLVLVTGPTGSGKSTTLASLVDHVNRTRSAHIVTIEDPIEYVFENKRCLVNQREVGLHTRSFAAALRAALREDPDVLLVGELRDLETMEMALETAEAGHLVFATLHANSAHTAIDRMIDVFPADRQPQIRVMLASSLRGVIAQMLCRRKAGGRVAAYEVLFGVPSVAHLIREGKAHQIPSVMQTGAKLGMRLMNDSLLELVRRGLVAPDEALARSNDRAALQAALRELSPDGA